MRNLWGLAGRIGVRGGKEVAGPGFDGGNKEGGRIQRGFFGVKRNRAGRSPSQLGDGERRIQALVTSCILDSTSRPCSPGSIFPLCISRSTLWRLLRLPLRAGQKVRQPSWFLVGWSSVFLSLRVVSALRLRTDGGRA
jgi:hypothetical protein